MYKKAKKQLRAITAVFLLNGPISRLWRARPRCSEVSTQLQDSATKIGCREDNQFSSDVINANRRTSWHRGNHANVKLELFAFNRVAFNSILMHTSAHFDAQLPPCADV